MTFLHFVRGLGGKQWLLVAAGIALVVVQVWMDLNLPAYMGKITLLLQTPGTGMDALLGAGGQMLFFALGSLAASCAAAVCFAALSYSVGGDLRGKVFHQVMRFSMEESDRFSPASLITRSTNDITQVQSFIVMGLQVIVKAPLTAIGAIGAVSASAWQWTATTVAGAVLIVAIVTATVAVVLPKQKRVQQFTDQINQVADANLTGIAVIHAYNAEDTAERKFSDTSKAMTENNLFVVRGSAIMGPVVQLVMNGMTLAIYWIGAVLISQTGTVEQAALFANMLAFAQYATQIVSAFATLTMVFSMVPRAMVSFRRIFEVIDTEPSVQDGGGADETLEEGTVEFRHVDFCYPGEDEPTVEDITFAAKKGETVAIIGSTGSGKSTVVNLIPRFYDATNGQVLVDGVDVRDYELNALRERIGYCPQQAELLSGTVRSNVCYGDGAEGTADDETVATALATSQADEFVAGLDGGLDAPVIQGGSNFSGGQRQRLSIARALEKSPEILILDDSTSALDYRTERKFREELAENYGDTTKIVITQRVGGIKDADRILVMDQGRIVGEGTHGELLESCEVYRQIVETQEGEVA